VQAKLAARAPRAIHPREVDSPYLLSGIMRCGKCGAAMVGHRGGYRYRYYMCGNARRKGREVCPSPILRKDKVEGFVINRIKDCILTDDNLEQLVRLTNEELAQTCAEEREKLELLQAQIAEADSRLGRLYDALETGEFNSGELAPRIQALFQKKEELLQAKADAEEALRYQAMDMADRQVVLDYVDDLRVLLERSSIIEQRGFLKSFVDKIEVSDSEVNMYYTIPMPPSSLAEETVGVIPFVHHGRRRGGRDFKKRGFAPLRRPFPLSKYFLAKEIKRGLAPLRNKFPLSFLREGGWGDRLLKDLDYILGGKGNRRREKGF